MHLRAIAIELGLVAPSVPTLIYNDNKSLVTHVRSSNSHKNARLISVWSLLRNSYNEGRIVLRWLCGKTQNLSDVLTKVKSPMTSLLCQAMGKGSITIY